MLFYGCMLVLGSIGLIAEARQAPALLIVAAIAGFGGYKLLQAGRKNREFVACQEAKRRAAYASDLSSRLEQYEKHQLQYDTFYQTPEWRQVRQAVVARDGNRCKRCGRAVSGEDLTVDHVKPRSVYPDLALDIGNLQVLCRRCNSSKSASIQ